VGSPTQSQLTRRTSVVILRDEMTTQRSFVFAVLTIAACSGSGSHADEPKQPGNENDAGPKSHGSQSGTAGSTEKAGSHELDASVDQSHDGPDGGTSGGRASDASTGGTQSDAGWSATPDAHASAWFHRVGAVLDDDSSVFCIVRTSGKKSGHLDATFRHVPSDPELEAQEPYAFTAGRLRARLLCSESDDGGGETKLVATRASEDAKDDSVSADCPSDLPHGSAAECQIEGHDESAPNSAGELRLIYLPRDMDADDVPHASGNTCIASITEAKAHGQLTGFDPEWMNASGQVEDTLPLYNEALMRSAKVGGTDEGAIFLAQGKLHFSFGDTSDLDTDDPVTMALDPPPGWRSNVLGYGTDFDARDGITLEGFEMGMGSQAQENVVSPHQTQENSGDEFTAIPLAGFGLTDAIGHRYRFLWFVSVHKWFDVVIPNFQANYSSLAYSVDEDPKWTRMPSPPSPPSANFGPGAIWFDRYNRWLYFFGMTPDHGPIQLARVRSGYADVIDPEQYEYWSGSAWVKTDLAAAADLIPSTSDHSARSEISVAYNPAADVYMMMLVNWYPAPLVMTSNQVELWQAPAVTGPWQKVDADAQLPNGNAVLTYGPMINEHLMIDGGLEVPMLLSQMYPVYNVHLWSYRIHVAEGEATADCPR
jgi:hypothetical protein